MLPKVLVFLVKLRRQWKVLEKHCLMEMICHHHNNNKMNIQCHHMEVCLPAQINLKCHRVSNSNNILHRIMVDIHVDMDLLVQGVPSHILIEQINQTNIHHHHLEGPGDHLYKVSTGDNSRQGHNGGDNNRDSTHNNRSSRGQGLLQE